MNAQKSNVCLYFLNLNALKILMREPMIPSPIKINSESNQ
jgi:hypothetical protein